MIPRRWRPLGWVAAILTAAGTAGASETAAPEQSPAEKVKQTVLLVAAERPADAADLAAARAVPAEDFLRPATDETHLGVLFPVVTPQDNPYINHLAAGARDRLSRPDVAWPPATDERVPVDPAHGRDYDPRRVAAEMDALWWLFANPASPLREDPEVLAFLLRRTLAYADSINAQPAMRPGKGFFDDFAIAPALYVLRELPARYPGLLLPGQRAAIQRALETTAPVFAEHGRRQLETRFGGYANIDVAISYELLNLGLALRSDELLALSRQLFDRQAAANYPDGATAYIGHQNESAGYHDVVAMFFARTHEITREPKPLDFLRQLEWYGPVSIGPKGEYWTAPSWKHTWNSTLAGIVGGEFVVGVTRNPYARGMLRVPQPGDDLRDWTRAREAVAWYRAGVPSAPLPQNYTVNDRNTVGPRAFYGRFSYAATLRDIPETEPGHATLMGAQLAGPNGENQAILMGVFPRVLIGSKPEEPGSWAWLTSGLQGRSIIGRSFSLVSGAYDLAVWRSSTKGPVVDWRGQQVWLASRDHLVGFVRVIPKSPDEPQGERVEGVVRLGTGGTVAGPKLPLENAGPNDFRYGELTVRMLEAEGADVITREAPFRLPRSPFAEIVVTPSGDAEGEAAPLRELGFAFELYPTASGEGARIDPLSAPAGVFARRITLGPQRFGVWVNFTDKEVTLNLPALPAGASASLRRSGEVAVLRPPFPPRLMLAPNESALLVVSDAADDHLPGWKSFTELVSQPSPP